MPMAVAQQRRGLVLLIVHPMSLDDFSPLAEEICSHVFSSRQSGSALSLVLSINNLWLTTEPLKTKIEINILWGLFGVPLDLH